MTLEEFFDVLARMSDVEQMNRRWEVRRLGHGFARLWYHRSGRIEDRRVRDPKGGVTIVTAVYNFLKGTEHEAMSPEAELPLALDLGLDRDLAIRIIEASDGEAPGSWGSTGFLLRNEALLLRARMLIAVGLGHLIP